MSRMLERSTNCNFKIDCGEGHDTADCETCVVVAAVERFSPVTLPRNEQVLGRLLVLDKVEDNHETNLLKVSSIAAYIWALCNVRPNKVSLIKSVLENLYTTYTRLSGYTRQRKDSKFLAELGIFKTHLAGLFDIKCSVQDHETLQNTMFMGVGIEKEDLNFYENQKLTPPVGNCYQAFDRHSAAKSGRLKTKTVLQTSANEHESEHCEDVIRFINSEFSTTRSNCSQSPTEFETTLYEFTNPEIYNPAENIRHVRHDRRTVKPEIYRAAQTLSLLYKMSGRQIEGAFIVVSGLFGRRWRPFVAHSEVDENTLPALVDLKRKRSDTDAPAVNGRSVSATQSFLEDDSFIENIDWQQVEQQIKSSGSFTSPPGQKPHSSQAPGFAERDRKMKYKSPISKKTSSQTRPVPPHQTPSRSPLAKLSRLSQPNCVVQNQQICKSNERSPKNKTSNQNSASVNKTPENRTMPPSPHHSDKPIKPVETTPIRGVPTRVKQLDVESPTLFSVSQKTSSDSSLDPAQPPKQSPQLDTSQFTSSFLFTPLKTGTQRQLYSTGLLSPYSSKSDETVRLGVPEEVFKLIDKIRGIKTLYPWQQKTVSLCLSGGNHIVTCPTSGGKTLVGELLLLNALLTRCTDAILVLPYVALVEEKVRELAEFAEHFSFGLERYAGSRGRFPPRKRRNKRAVYVATIEKANSLFNSLYEEGRCSEIGLVVVDELHMIGDGYRGAILETCLTKFLTLKSGPRIIGMTATLNNHKEIAGFLKCSMEHVGGPRPVTLSEHVKMGETIYKVDKTTQDLISVRQSTPLSSPVHSNTTDKDCVASLVQEVLPERVLVFCPTKKSCETTSVMLTNTLQSTGEEMKHKRRILIDRITAETGHMDPAFSEMLTAGVSYHHSGLTGDERILVEEAFSTGVLSVLCCTSTLAAGVNLPASRVIIRSVKIGTSILTRTRYLQMVGRAGRTGLAASGDSFLLGSVAEKKLLRDLVFGQLEDVRSCLDQESLALTLLHLIGSGMIQSSADLGMFMKKTLLYHQAPDTCLTVADTALKFLQDSSFVQRSEGNIQATPFGKAVYKSSLDPTISHKVMQGIREANRHLVLLGDLHLVYLCVPPILEGIYVDWQMYFDAYSQFDETTRLTFTAAALQESYLARRAFSSNRSDVEKEVPYKRFYVAGALHKLISGVPSWRVSAMFKIPRGTLQSALSSAVSHASKLAHFTKELPDYWALSSVFEALVQKLFFAGSPELAQILEIPGIKHARAKLLYKAGYKSLQKLAAAEPRLLASDIEHLTQAQAQKIISSAKIMLQEQADALTDAALQLLEEV